MFARRIQQLAVGMVALLVIVGGAGAADGPATNADLHAQESLVWTKTILDTYNATIVDEEAPWHDDARELIQVYIQHLVDVYPGAQPVPTLAKAERMGRDLLAAGCDSPIVQIIYGRILFAQGLVGEAQPYLLSGYQAARETPNLQLLLATTAIRLAQCSEAMGQPDDASKYHAEAVTALVAVASNTMYLEDDQSALLEILVNYCLNELSLASRGELVRRTVAEEGSGEWLCKMLAGLWHLEQIREGGGAYRSSSAASWAGSIEPYLQPGSSPADSADMARRLLTAAWELRPERPRPAAAMVMLSAYRQSNSFDYETWFRRAITAQLDYDPAHLAYIQRVAVDSPWQLEQMLQTYGRSRLAGDYETLEPYYYFMAVTTAVRSANRYSYGHYYGQSSGPTLTSAAVKRNFKTLLNGYDGADLSGELLTHVNLMSAAVSCLEKDWPRARKYLDAIDDLPGRMGQAKWLFDRLELNANLQIAQVYAKTGPAADALGEAMKLYGQKDYDGALAILYDTADAHRDDYWTTQYLHYSIRYTLTTRDWMAGLWVDITPSASLAGWRVEQGRAWVDANGRAVCMILISPGSDNWTTLIADRGFQSAYELRCQVSFPGKWIGPVGAGPVLDAHDPYQRYAGLTLCTNGKFGLLTRNSSLQYESSHFPLQDVNTIYTQVWKQRVRAFVNGSEAMDRDYLEEMLSVQDASSARIAIGGRSLYPRSGRSSGESVYRPALFNDIQIRRLTAMPPTGTFDANYQPAMRISTYSPAYGDPRIEPPETNGEPIAPDGGQDAPADGAGTDAPTTENTETPADDDDADDDADPDAPAESSDAPSLSEDDATPDDDADADSQTPIDGADDDQDAPAEPQDETTPDETPGSSDQWTNRADSPPTASAATATNNRSIRLGDAAPVVAAAEMAAAEEVQQAWACSMHPQIQAAEAGDCPICAMALIAIEIDQADAPDDDAPAEVDADTDGEWVDAQATQPVASATGSLFRTDLIGGEDGEAFEDAIRSQGYLIGLRLRFAKDLGVINSIQPIYRTPGGRRYGGRVGLGAGRRVDVVARKGYAVGSLTASGADQPGGLQVAFMRVTPTGQLDPADSYTSQWYGPGSGGSQTSTDGRLPVGLAGRMAGSLQAIGLIATDTPFLAGLDIPTGDLGPAQAPSPTPRRDMVDLDGHYYMPLKSRLTWDQANQHCQAMGGRLVQIDSNAEDELIAAMWIRTQLHLAHDEERPLWIGARPNESGQWVWASGDELTYTGWLAGHPEALGYIGTSGPEQEEHPRPPEAATVGLGGTTRWINMAASYPNRYICEWDHEPTDDELSVHPPVAPAAAAPRVQMDVGDVIPYNGHWYKAFYDIATWYDAKAHCQSLGGHLLYVNDAEENAFAEMFVLNTGYPMLWIGATDEAKPGEWFWLDGTKLDYANWGYGEPNVLGNEHAAALIYRPDISGWNNLPGATELAYMCEWDYDPTAPAQPEGDAADE